MDAWRRLRVSSADIRACVVAQTTVDNVTHPNQFDGPMITTVGEYDGGPTVRISATQLGTDYSPSQAKKIVAAWCDFFAAGPTPISRLAFTTRTPKRLFASLREQTQLTALAVKWGDYDDLSPLARMPDLRELWLGGASRVRTLTPLAELRRLRSLAIEDLLLVHDLTPLAGLTGLVSLIVGGDWKSSRRAHVDSIGFLRQLSGLERLLLHTIAADDCDYSPLLDLHALKEVRVARVRGMQPSHEELSAAIPALMPLPK
jgi:hypothetical protein